MRVCFFVPSYLPDIGGIALNTHKLVLALEGAGCSVSVLAPYSKGVVHAIEVSHRLRRYRMPRFRGWGGNSLLLPLWLEKQRYGFDILHCHGLEPMGHVGRLFRSLTSTPLVITPRSVGILISRKGWRHRLKERRLEKTLMSADRVTAISTQIQEILVGKGRSRSSVVYIPNGVDFPEFSRQRQPSSDSLYILALGRFRHVKGFDVLISAFQRIQDAFPRVKLVIAGGGKKEKDLKSVVERLNLGEKVLFPGVVLGEEKVRVYQNCLFFVFPSRAELEGCPNVVLEAMAAGRPVVGSDIGGTRDIISHEEDGLLVAPNDPDSLAEGMRKMLEDPVERERMAKKAQNKARSFDFPQIASRYIALYQELLISQGKL